MANTKRNSVVFLVDFYLFLCFTLFCFHLVILWAFFPPLHVFCTYIMVFNFVSLDNFCVCFSVSICVLWDYFSVSFSFYFCLFCSIQICFILLFLLFFYSFLCFFRCLFVFLWEKEKEEEGVGLGGWGKGEGSVRGWWRKTIIKIYCIKIFPLKTEEE